MGERYNRCSCGSECQECNGTGFRGNALDYEKRVRPRQSYIVPTHAAIMELAVSSMDQLIERERERKMTEIAVKTENSLKLRKQIDLAAIDNFMIRADINAMNDDQINNYVRKLCELVAINPITRPFDIMVQQGRKVIYANKGCAEQLRNIWNVSIRIVKREVIEGVYTVTAAAQLGGRVDESTGCVWIEGLKGDARANAMMKSETKAKRRVTLSICGLNMPDDSEVESIPGAKRQERTFDSEKPLTPAVITPISQSEKSETKSESESNSETFIRKPSQAQLTRLFAIARANAVTNEELRDILRKEPYFVESTKDLDIDAYNAICDQLENMSVRDVPVAAAMSEDPGEGVFD